MVHVHAGACVHCGQPQQRPVARPPPPSASRRAHAYRSHARARDAAAHSARPQASGGSIVNAHRSASPYCSGSPMPWPER